MQNRKSGQGVLVTEEYISGLRYQTPYFLFSKKEITVNFKAFKKHFKGSSIFYALKANSELGVIKTIHKLGGSFEVASVYELNILKKLQINPKKIIYGTSVKPSSHIKQFYDYGVKIFACDSISEIDKIATVAPKSKIFVRVRVNDTGSVFKFSEKFGTDIKNVFTLMTHAKTSGLIPYGISFHVGSQASNPKAWSDAINYIVPIIKKLKNNGIKLSILNIGGGFPAEYLTTVQELGLATISENVYQELKKLPYKIRLVLEPGRRMVASSGYMIASVIGRVSRNGTPWLFLDAGVYNGLFETMAYQGSTRYRITALKSTFDSGEMLFSLAGPTGDSPDIITKEALLPKDIEVGDKLVIHGTGAYSIVCTSPFNGFPKPKTYIV